jgi:hypothetical protein
MRPAAMCHMALFSTQYRALLIASLVSSCLLMGCESSNYFERYYRPAATREGAPAATLQPRATSPQLVYSHNLDRDDRLLQQHGYVLIGTTSFNGAAELPYADRAFAQGQKVGAAIVLLNVRSYRYSRAVLGSFYVSDAAGASYFASYWAKSDPANTSGLN